VPCVSFGPLLGGWIPHFVACLSPEDLVARAFSFPLQPSLRALLLRATHQELFFRRVKNFRSRFKSLCGFARCQSTDTEAQGFTAARSAERASPCVEPQALADAEITLSHLDEHLEVVAVEVRMSEGLQFLTKKLGLI
jgi:hypothetical protein